MVTYDFFCCFRSSAILAIGNMHASLCPDELWVYKSLPMQSPLSCCHFHSRVRNQSRIPRLEGTHFKLSESSTKVLFTRPTEKAVLYLTTPHWECGLSVILYSKTTGSGIPWNLCKGQCWNESKVTLELCSM